MSKRTRSQGLLKRSAGAPDLSATTSQKNNRYLDANVAASDIRKASAMPSYVGLELPALPPLQP